MGGEGRGGEGRKGGEGEGNNESLKGNVFFC